MALVVLIATLHSGMEILSSRVLVRPADLARSLHFYGEILGLHVHREFGQGAHRGVVFFLGNGLLEVSGHGGEAPTSATQLWLQVASAADAHQRLAAAGVVIDEPPVEKPWGLIELRARDPDGLVLVFVEVPADHPLRRDRRLAGVDGGS